LKAQWNEAAREDPVDPKVGMQNAAANREK
jgi:hypothetical protein